MPQWAIVLTLVFSGLSLLGSGLGALVHVRLSAKNSGRLEEKVDGACRRDGAPAHGCWRVPTGHALREANAGNEQSGAERA